MGRPKGATNKVTRAFREALVTVYNGMGGDAALLTWARRNKTDFYKICARLIPVEKSPEGGEGEGTVERVVIVRVIGKAHTDNKVTT